MSDYTVLVSILEQFKRNGTKAVLCYRNSNEIVCKAGEPWYGAKKLPWSNNWYFDQTRIEFISSNHFRHYYESSAIVMTSDADTTKLIGGISQLNKDYTASAWCALELCLAKEIYLVGNGTYTKTTPLAIYRSVDTHEVYKLTYQALIIWLGGVRTKRDYNKTKIAMRKAVMVSNNKTESDVDRLCGVLYDYTSDTFMTGHRKA
jgi:hypothetical protein